MNRSWILACVMLPFLAASQLLAQTAWDWKIELVDPGPGEFTSLVRDKAGNLHLAYRSLAQNTPAIYAFRDSSGKWFKLPLESNYSVTGIALDSKDRPGLCYPGRTSMNYSFFDGKQWRTQVIAKDSGPKGFTCSITYGKGDVPHIVWYQEKTADYRFFIRSLHAVLKDGAWEVGAVDTCGQSGKWNAMTTDREGRVYIAYDCFLKGDLRVAASTNDDWKIEVIDARYTRKGLAQRGSGVSIVADSKNRLHLSSINADPGTMSSVQLTYYTQDSNGRWVPEPIRTGSALNTWFAFRSSIALDAQDNPYIAFEDMGNLSFAYRENGKWLAYPLVSSASGHRFQSLAVDPDGKRAYISFIDAAGSVRVAIGSKREVPSTTTALQSGTEVKKDHQ